MDAGARAALDAAVRAVVAHDLDTIDARLAALEASVKPREPPRRAEYIEERVRAAVDLRARGATLEAIAAKLGV